MSSAISYSWGIAWDPPEVVLRKNKNFLIGKMNRSIEDVNFLVLRWYI